MKRIEEFGQQVSDALNNSDEFAHIRNELYLAALDVSGCPEWMLQDEERESHPYVQLYYRTLSGLMASVLMAAAQKQTYYKELDK